MNLNKPGDYFVIPIGMCKYIVQHKLFRTFQVFMFLKLHSSGVISWNENTKMEIANTLKVSKRSVEIHIKKLEEINCVSRKKDVFYLRSFACVCNTFKVEDRIGVVFYPENLIRIKPFFIASIIGFVINGIRIKMMKDRKGLGSRINGRNDKSTRSSYFHHVPLANCIVASICNCSISTASVYKNMAVKNGYIDVIPDNTILKICPDQYWAYKKHAPKQHSKHVFIVNGNVVERGPDLATSFLKYKYRAKRRKPIY